MPYPLLLNPLHHRASDNHHAQFIAIFFLNRVFLYLVPRASPDQHDSSFLSPPRPRYLYSSRSSPSIPASNRERKPFALRRSFGACVRVICSFVRSGDGRLRVVSDEQREEGGQPRGGAGGGHRVPVRVRDVGDGLHAVLVGVRGGARGRRHLQLQLGIDGKLRDVFAHGAAPAQEGAVKVLRRQVAVLRVARGGREPGGPGQAAEQAAQGVAELRGRAAGRCAPQPLRAPQCRGLQEGVQGTPLRARQGAHHQADAPASHGERGEATGVARARSPAVCLGGSPTVRVGRGVFQERWVRLLRGF